MTDLVVHARDLLTAMSVLYLKHYGGAPVRWSASISSSTNRDRSGSRRRPVIDLL